MDWEGTRVRDYPLTILVTDIRGSSKVLCDLSNDDVSIFMHEFANLTYEALEGIKDHSINNFLGDGFLVFFSDSPGSRTPPSKKSVRRAVDVALKMRKAFDVLCQRHHELEPTAGFNKMGFVAGIAYGSVIYGRFTGETILRATGITTEVTLAFRLAQRAESGKILMSQSSYKNFSRGPFRPQKRTVSLKGYGRVPCHEVLPVDPV